MTAPRSVAARRGPGATPESGAALITAMMAMLLIMALGSALVLLSVTETGISAHHRDAARVFYAAESGLQYAFALVARSDDWTSLLAGRSDAAFRDGPPGGGRRVGGVEVDLERSTSLLRCGRPSACSEDERTRRTADRPWGTNNPAWQPVGWGPLGRLVPGAADGDVYVVVWIGDDPDEADGAPWTDEASAKRPGHGAIRLVSQGFGPMGARRGVEALVVRETVLPAAASEDPGDVRVRRSRTRMVSWREVR